MMGMFGASKSGACRGLLAGGVLVLGANSQIVAGATLQTQTSGAALLRTAAFKDAATDLGGTAQKPGRAWLAAVLLAACAGAPPRPELAVDNALAPAQGTRLDERVQHRQHRGDSAAAGDEQDVAGTLRRQGEVTAHHVESDDHAGPGGAEEVPRHHALVVHADGQLDEPVPLGVGR